MFNRVRDVALVVVGWLLVVAGLGALVLPGPGLLLLFFGLVLLSQRYDWADRQLDRVRDTALATSAANVQSWWRLTLSLIGAVTLIVVGTVWGLAPPAPGWWPLDAEMWLFGGWSTGAVMILSGAISLGLLGYSWFALRGLDDPASVDPS